MKYLLTLAALISLSVANASDGDRFFNYPPDFPPIDTLPSRDSVRTDSLPFSSSLRDLRVNSKKPLVEMQVNKLVLNVGNDLTAAAGNLFEIIQKAPGVSVTNDEAFNMAGKSGVTILIDGRPTQLSGKDLVNYLRSVPGSLVDQVEIISNPSARYDAQGNAGIINIRLKKVVTRGTNGNLGAGWTQSVHARKNISAMLNHRTGKLNINTTAALGKANQFTNGRIVREVQSGSVQKIFDNRTVDQDASENYNMNLAVDFYANNRHSFGSIVKVNRYNNPMYTPGQTLIRFNNQTDSSLRTINDNRTTNNLKTINLNYKYADTLLGSVNVDADHTSFLTGNRSFVTTDLLDRDDNKYGYTANDQQVKTTIRIYSFKVDYEKTLKKPGISMEAGFKWNTIETGNDLNAKQFLDNAMQTDTGRTNKFEYRETMIAGYITLTRKVMNWEYQVGLRGEKTVIRGQSVDLKKNQLNYPDSNYFNLFPTVFIRHQLNEKNSIGLSYSRRLNRPGYRDLNPFEYIFDNYTRESGNPYLQPEFSQRIELSLAMSYSLNISAGIGRTTNLMNSISRQVGEITRESDYNIGKSNEAFMNISYNKRFYPWWSVYINLSPFYKKYDAAVPEGAITAGTVGMGWYASNNFTAGKDWKFQLSSWGNIATQDGIYHTRGLGSVDAGAGKAFFEKKLDVRVSILDLFNTQRWIQRVDFADVKFDYRRKWESRALRLQLTWKFGRSSYKARDRSLGADSENERIKTKQ